jgi:hypothetical protein
MWPHVGGDTHPLRVKLFLESPWSPLHANNKQLSGGPPGLWFAKVPCQGLAGPLTAQSQTVTQRSFNPEPRV